MSANEHINELLSGFLDGELTADELREFELAMLADATLQVRLEQLRALGSDLRAVPKRTLGPDFTKRVLAAVDQKAVSLPIDHDRRGSWPMVATYVALAATMLLAVFLANQFYSGSQLPGENLANTSVETRNPSGEQPLVEQPLKEQPLKEQVSGGVASMDGVPVDMDSAKLDETFVGNDPHRQKRVLNQAGFSVLTIIEIEPSPKAWKDNEVSKILKESGIVWTNPVKASDDVMGVLSETRSISKGLKKSDDEQLALIMVMANGRRMDKALNRVLEDVDTFPHVLIDLAFDLPGKELCQKLVDAQISVANGREAIATPIVAGALASGYAGNEGLESFAQFSHAPPARYLEAEKRQAGQSGNAILADEEDAISYVLFIVRQPAK